MTYSQSALKHEDITFVRAVLEYEAHGLTDMDLINDLGRFDYYTTDDVFAALGY